MCIGKFDVLNVLNVLNVIDTNVGKSVGRYNLNDRSSLWTKISLPDSEKFHESETRF